MIRILGIDPGLKTTGWGIIDVEGNNLKYVSCGTISSNAKDSLDRRLLSLHNGLTHIIQQYQPNGAAIEETFLNKNAMSSLKLGHGRGALILSVSLAAIPLKEYAATLVKKSIVGVGRAEKQQVQMMIKHLLPQADVESHDAADALAVAICHAHHDNLNSKIAEAG